MARLTRRVRNSECYDTDDPNKLPLISAKEEYGGKTTVLTAVLIDGDRAWFDEAATHGRTPMEQNITTWTSRPEDVKDGRTIDIVWLFIRPIKGEYVYHGAAASNMIIDEQSQKGYKYLADHANQLGKAVKGEFDLEGLSPESIAVLIDTLNTYPEVLDNSSPELKKALGLLSNV